MYGIVNLFSDTEFQRVTQIVESQTRVISGKKSLTLEKYHLVVNNGKHQEIGNKKLRVLNQRDASLLMSLPGTVELLSRFPNTTIGQVVYNSKERDTRPEFYFRLVRPRQRSDVGNPHCDFWFHEAEGNGWKKCSTTKVWIPLMFEPHKNSLCFFPDAPSEVPFRVEEINGFKRPRIDLPLGLLGEPYMPSLEKGQALLFRDDVLHAGPLNQGDSTRVSLEFTLVDTILNKGVPRWDK
jgi:hypothetical protein